MTNRINGDFDQDSIEAFRSAYAAQILEPEDLETDPYTGLPSNVVLNTSPWIQHTGLWKANDGTDKNFVPNQVLVAGEQEEGEVSEEELDAMLNELLEEEARLEELEEGPYDEDEEDSLGFTDEELEELVANLTNDEDEIDVDALVDELLGTLIEEDIETSIDQTDEEFEEEEIGDDEIDALIAELEAELEAE